MNVTEDGTQNTSNIMNQSRDIDKNQKEKSKFETHRK